jgi:superfamily I DNA/RNA helicase
MRVALSNSLASIARKLSPTDAQRVWTFLAKFGENPAHPSLSLERIDKTKHDDLWSGRISDGLRAVIHKEGENWTVLYVGQHDDAYNWAKTRIIERHVKTGALQVVVAPEVVAPIVKADPTPASQPGLFAQYPDDYLLTLGLPPVWLPTIRQIRSKEVLLNTVLELPEEVAERLLELAEGGFVTPPVPLAEDRPTIESQDTRRRFVVLDSNHDLLRMLEAPLATWIAFLHPSQQQLATGTFSGPVKVTGSAGTGKTVVGLHRARHLARLGKRVLLTSFVTTLCRNLERNLQILCTPEELERITVTTVHKQAKDLLRAAGESVEVVDDEEIKQLLERFSYKDADAPNVATISRSPTHFLDCPLDRVSLWLEWESIIQAQGITSWDEYRTANRAGRGQPLTVKERKQVWQVFEGVLNTLQSKGQTDWSGLCRLARKLLNSGKVQSPYDAVIVDELQDLRPQEIKLLVTLAGEGTDHLMLLGDGGQRIYAGRFSLKALGIDVRGRSHVLRINYRMTEQIRSFADQVVDSSSDDLDGNHEQRRGTISLLKGPEPTMQGFKTQLLQNQWIVNQVSKLLSVGLSPNEIAIFARTSDLLKTIESSLKAAGIPCQQLSREEEPTAAAVNLATMHRAKGLEFKAVFVVNVSDELMPFPYAFKLLSDQQAREAAIERERQLLYVSVTRARDEVFVTWVGQPSRFLEEVLTAPNSMKANPTRSIKV